MVRVQVFSSFLAAGVCFALLAPGSRSQSEPTWDFRESKSDLFDQHTKPSASRAVYASTARTQSKWQGTRIYRAAGKSRSVSGQPMGAVLSLVSFNRISSTLTTCQNGPDNNQPPVFVSVKMGGADTLSCSTSAGQEAPYCSVEDSSAQGSCSTLGAGQTYCSTGPSGAPGGSIITPTQCSVITDTSLSSCSTFATSSTCSTQAGQGGAGDTYCSVLNSQGGSCSTGSLAGQGNNNPMTGLGSTCSATSTLEPENGQGGNFCSVTGSGTAKLPNVCSADSVNSKNSFCSVSSINSSDFCSVMKGQTNVSCTVLGNGNNGSTCSCKFQDPQVQCSVKGVNNGNNPYKPGTICVP